MDHQLTEALAADLDKAFPALLVEYQDLLYSTCLRLTGSVPDAQDVTQEALIRAYRALKTYERARIEELKLRPWLWTIALNLVRNRARNRSRRPQQVALEETDAPLHHSADPGDSVASAMTVAGQLEALPESQRVAVVLRYIGELSTAEIAATLQKPVGTVKSNIHRGLAAMRASLDLEEAR